MIAKPLTDLERKPLSLVLGDIGNVNADLSAAAGKRLVSSAKEYGLNLRDYLNLAVDVRASFSQDEKGRNFNPFQLNDGNFLTGYQAALAELNLPFKNDFNEGVLLQAASDTFQYKPGTRALFPEVIDDMLRWSTKQELFEKTEGLVANSRTISGPQLITTAIFDDKETERHSGPIAELANIPTQTLTDTEHSVKFHKFGSAIKTSYEFSRRVSLDILTPYAARVERQREIDKVRMLSHILVNGDAVFAPATAMDLATFGGDFTGGKTLKDNYVALFKFLAKRAKDGLPINIMIGSFDMYIEIFLMFMPTTSGVSVAEHLQKHGGPRVSTMLDLLQGVEFRLSSGIQEGYLMCYSKEDTIEELNEAGSQISESEQAIGNQSIKYVRTMNHGYRLIYGDTRVLLKCKA